jgi:hypothetical protein
VDPWGTVLAQCPDRDGYALADLDLDYLERFREEFPALENRRPEAYDWGRVPDTNHRAASVRTYHGVVGGDAAEGTAPVRDAGP